MHFENNLSVYNYSVAAPMGIVFKAKSIILKTKEKLVVISPANFDESTISYLKESKLDKVFIAPNNLHNVNLKLMKDSFPNAQFFGPKRSEKVSGVELQRNNHSSIEGELIPIKIEGNYKLGETCFFHTASKSLILTDLLFNMNHEMNFSSKLMFKCAGTYKRLAMSRLVKMTINDNNLFRESLKELLKYPFEKVVLNHGDDISREQFENTLENLL